MTTLVDSGATEHFLDDDLIPGLKGSLMNPTPLHVPKTRNWLGKRPVPYTAPSQTKLVRLIKHIVLD